MSSLILPKRLRRNRKSVGIRNLNSETSLSVSNLICPFFIKENLKGKEEIKSLPGVYRWGLDSILPEVEKVCDLGINAIILFPVIPASLKDNHGSYSTNHKNILCRSISEIKKKFPELVVISDIALDPYTIHGHDGILNHNNDVVNDETVRILGEIALLHSEMGVDIVAPSDMMDGRVGYIRSKLDQSGYVDVSIMSYSIKYASSFYHPFRDALNSHLVFGDKKSYQMNPKNSREALIEAQQDEVEGADILMVKPAGPYLDIIQRLRTNTYLPIAAYQVSGEYAMIIAAAQNGWLEEESSLYESLISIKRSGADMIISYGATKIALLLKNGIVS